MRFPLVLRRLALLGLAGCSPAEPAGADPASFRTSCSSLSNAELRARKHVRDGERFTSAEMLDHAEREFWLAELEAFGLDAELEAYARNARIEVRERRRAVVQLGMVLGSSPGRGFLCRLLVPPEQVEITRILRDAERAEREGRSSDADRGYASAERLILALPDAAPAMTDLLPFIRSSRSRLWECRSP